MRHPEVSAVIQFSRIYTELPSGQFRLIEVPKTEEASRVRALQMKGVKIEHIAHV